MTYTISWTRGKKCVTLRSFAGMILWASDPAWQWAVGLSVERFVDWVSSPPGRATFKWQQSGAMRLAVSE